MSLSGKPTLNLIPLPGFRKEGSYALSEGGSRSKSPAKIQIEHPYHPPPIGPTLVTTSLSCIYAAPYIEAQVSTDKQVQNMG